MLLTPLLSVSALAVPPLAQATHQFSSIITHQSTQPADQHHIPFASRRVRHTAVAPISAPSLPSIREGDADVDDFAVHQPWPPPAPNRPASTSNIPRWNSPATRNEKDLKQALATQFPNNYNIKQETVARSSTTLTRHVEHHHQHRGDVVVVPQQHALQNPLRGGSASVYSVKNQVSSHVSHLISRNFSYVKNSTVSVSTGFEQVNQSHSNRSSTDHISRMPAGQIDRQTIATQSYNVPYSKDKYPNSDLLNVPFDIHRPNHFSTPFNTKNRTEQTSLSENVDQSECVFVLNLLPV